MTESFVLTNESQLSKALTQKKAVDVVSNQLGGQIVSFSDEWFADAENLIKPSAPIRDATKFTYKGAWYDGWETRRHNEQAYDWVIIKFGVHAATIIGAEIDTAFFNGNHAPAISVDALYSEDNAASDSAIEENDPRWKEVIHKVECGPSQRHFLLRETETASDDEKFNFVKLKMYPDGGIARFRLFGKVQKIDNSSADIRDLAYVGNGGVISSYSDQHFGSTNNLILPGRGHDMSDGWETKRSRNPGHTDWVIVELGSVSSFIEKIIVDTAHFRGNFPQYISVHGIKHDGKTELTAETEGWNELVGKYRTSADKEHVYDINNNMNISHVKLTIFPDGGVKRIRVWGY